MYCRWKYLCFFSVNFSFLNLNLHILKNSKYSCFRYIMTSNILLFKKVISFYFSKSGRRLLMIEMVRMLYVTAPLWPFSLNSIDRHQAGIVPRRKKTLPALSSSVSCLFCIFFVAKLLYNYLCPSDLGENVIFSVLN